MSIDPIGSYRVRLEARRADVRRHERRDRTLSGVRLAVAAAGVLAWGLSLGPHGISPAWLGLAMFTFLVLVVVHEAVARAMARARRRVSFYDRALVRAGEDWAGTGEGGNRFDDPAHPYASDLDLFGRGSLFERLCTARTRSGEETLAAWLRTPAPPAAVIERQAAVGDVGPRVELREDLAVLGVEARHAVDSASLRRWSAAPPVEVPASLRGQAVLFSCLAFATLAGWLAGWWTSLPFAIAALCVGALSRAARRWTDPILGGMGRPIQALQTLEELLTRLESEPFEAPLLLRLRSVFLADGMRPAIHLKHLRRWIEIHDSKRNVLFAPLAFLMVWDLHLASAIERWRQRAGRSVPAWLDSLGEIEALAALGGYAFENPDDPFPTFVEHDGPLFQGRGLGLPLLPASRSIRNDVELDRGRRLLVITGSNMSGKSTLLRTVGLNTVLAHAGGPVRAHSLRLSPLAVGASIRIVDSLQQGQSRFYAEITRIRQVMDLAAGRPPALFLLDEIFHGTNSADRRVGAEAVVRSLVRREAIGLVTSHDLALAQIADSLAPQAANVHFEDHLEDGRLAFDYRLKPGAITRGNALALMRAVGLDV